MTDRTVFHLKVRRIEQVCSIELAWGRGQQRGATIPFPAVLTEAYGEWQRTYLRFYTRAFRGRVAEPPQPIQAPPQDWHRKLVEAEAKLLYEFHRWLRQEELFAIRAEIAKASVAAPEAKVQVFLTCTPIEIARLPWEAWEIGVEFAADNRIRFVRMPANVEGTPQKPRRGRARILVILGDETGLSFKEDKEAVAFLKPLADIEFVGWQQGQDVVELKSQIAAAIADERGWDVLLFAGHSNEDPNINITGGELGIAPRASLLLREIHHSLRLAKDRGLQFALFNSCSGLSIADTCIDLGIPQVAVMREPIHNRVAQEFLWCFLQRLAQHDDVQEALAATCRYLKTDKHLTYPSTTLVPSLFLHPDANLFRLEPLGWKYQLRRWMPRKLEAIALGVFLVASWQLPVQNWLLNRRVLVQAYYRQLTQQIPNEEPPVMLVQIDEESIFRGKISDPKPIDRKYLADLIDAIVELDAKVVGVDYLLDRYQEQDPILAASFQNAVRQHETWFIFSMLQSQDGKWLTVLPDLAPSTMRLQGDTKVYGNPIQRMQLAPLPGSEKPLPLSYVLALAAWLNFEHEGNPPQPQIDGNTDWQIQLNTYLLQTTGKDEKTIFSASAQTHPLTNFFYPFSQRWLHPIVDFSIPPNRTHKSIPAWQIIERSPEIPASLETQPIVLIAAGGYGEAGIVDGSDNFEVPLAVEYWRSRPDATDRGEIMTGGEKLSYMTHHFLSRRLVVPIPDLWLVLVAALLGKAVTLLTERRSRTGVFYLSLLICTLVYGFVSLQLYISGTILLPIVLPIAVFWTYILLALYKEKHHA